MIEDVYTEMAALLSEVESVGLVDLWNEQPFYEEHEDALPKVSVFLEFNADNMSDMGNNSQMVDAQVTVYVNYKSMGRTKHGDARQEQTLGFLRVLQAVHLKLQGIAGTSYGKPSRIAMRKLDAPEAYNILYAYVYSVNWMDTSTTVVNTVAEADAERDFEVERTEVVPVGVDLGLFKL